MIEERRGFLKRLGKAGAAAAVAGTTVAFANSGHKRSYTADSNGVVIGKSKKKEIIYHKTAIWNEYLNSAK
ncbi:twin-arginine translocation signal domain-containing protein [Sulfurovum sp. ST-21]|uniref:Twin-arginine translocation signal domain-containing protein n=1 Tax=Sulfurovum indicum TaxID=2779528 RepID=A0A7M1S1C2_9BACT|nr:twin-arginine translocation signal domain-containing protein [Sulfurovum indicum]QOR61263.1 twin-arginine translocation signal domain-containing protein [Sulfurovum indicum]